jgi:hypothetical protein
MADDVILLHDGRIRQVIHNEHKTAAADLEW